MRLRFTIRDLLRLAVVAAMGVGFWLEHARADKMAREADSLCIQLSESQKELTKAQVALERVDLEMAKLQKSKNPEPTQ